MKVLVTGGAGFIGSHVVDALIDQGHEVVIIDNLSTGKKENLNPKAKFIEQDISDPKTTEIIIQEKPEAIFHLAAHALVPKSVKDPIHDANVNVVGFLNLMQGAVKAGTKKVVYTSTGGAMYGDDVPIPTPETQKELPPSPYGISKLSGEHYLRFYRDIYKINATILRYSNVYGPRQNPFGEGGAVAIFTQKLLSKEKPTLFGHGQMTRDYVYVGDVAGANVLALDSNELGPFNIATGTEISTEDLFRKIQKIVGSDIEPDYADARPGEVVRSCLDSTNAKEILGWMPETPLDQGLALTFQYLKDSNK